MPALVQHHGQRPRPRFPALAQAHLAEWGSFANEDAWSLEPWVGILPLALVSCVGLGIFLRALEPQFPPAAFLGGEISRVPSVCSGSGCPG